MGRRKVDSSPLECFLGKIEVEEGCWLWVGGKTSAQYGHLRIEGKPYYAHRFSYEWFVGPILRGLDLDHLCRNPSCVNPDHLEPVTHRENLMRSPIAVAAINARKTHCPQGHEYNYENTQVGPRGRSCRTCKARQARARYSRLKESR